MLCELAATRELATINSVDLNVSGALCTARSDLPQRSDSVEGHRK